MFEGAFKVQFCDETTASRILDGSCNIVKLEILKGEGVFLNVVIDAGQLRSKTSQSLFEQFLRNAPMRLPTKVWGAEGPQTATSARSSRIILCVSSRYLWKEGQFY